jgi:hypothetical protein
MQHSHWVFNIGSVEIELWHGDHITFPRFNNDLNNGIFLEGRAPRGVTRRQIAASRRRENSGLVPTRRANLYTKLWRMTTLGRSSSPFTWVRDACRTREPGPGGVNNKGSHYRADVGPWATQKSCAEGTVTRPISGQWATMMDSHGCKD